MDKEIIDFYSFKPDKQNMKKIEVIATKNKRNTMKNTFHLEDKGGCVALKTSDLHIYQFSIERVNRMMNQNFKNLQELETFLQEANEEIISKMIKNDNSIFDQKIEFVNIPE